MKSKIQKIQILKKGLLLILILAIFMPTIAYAYSVNDGMLLQDSTAIEKLMYGEIGSIVKKIEEHFKSHTTLYITTENQLRALAAYVDNGNSCYGKKIEILNDIEVNSDIDWEPIGNMYSQFSGTFDGNGFSIINLTYRYRNSYQTSPNYNDGRSCIGFFGVVSDRGIVKNLKVIDSNITTDGTKVAYTEVGNIAGRNYGLIMNCDANIEPENIYNPNLPSYDYYIGLLVGLNKGLIENGEEITFSQSVDAIHTTNGSTSTVNIKLSPVEKSKFKVGDTLELEFSIDKNLFNGVSNGEEIDLIGNVSENENLKLQFPRVTIGEGVAIPVSATRENNAEDEPITILKYKYEVRKEEKIEFDNEELLIDFEHNVKGEKLYIYCSEEDTFNSGYLIKGTVEYSNLNVYVNSTNPFTKIDVAAKNLSSSERYSEGTELIIKLRTNEKIQATTEVPEIEVYFHNSGLGKYNYQEDPTKGNAMHVDALIDEEGKTTWIYSYIVQPGDEGILEIKQIAGYLTDLAGNFTDLESDYKSIVYNIYADTTSPKVEIITKDVENSITNKEIITYEFIWSEEIDEFTKDNITVINGEKGELVKVEDKEFASIKAVADLNSDGIIKTEEYANLITIVNKLVEENEEKGENVEDTIDLKYDFNGDEVVDINDVLKVVAYVNKIYSGTDKISKYTMNITNNIEDGNIGDLQVIIEANECQDLLGHSNVRTESVIRVDKKAPILNNVEAYADLEKIESSKKLHHKVGDEIKVVATFDESIVIPEDFPALKLQFSESGEAKGEVEAQIEGNKLVYTYTIKDGDYGALSISALSGKVKDVAGNETRVTKRSLEGDTILADTIAPKLKEINVVSPEEGIYKEGDTITFEAIYDEEVYILKEVQVEEKQLTDEEDNNEENKEDDEEEVEEEVIKEEIVFEEINSTNAPILKIKFGNGEEREAYCIGYAEREDGSLDRSKLIYTYEITPTKTITTQTEVNGEIIKKTETIDGDNGELIIISLNNREEKEEHKKYEVCKYYDVCDIAVNDANNGTDEKNANGIIADTQRPEIKNVYANVEHPIISNTENYYKAGNEVTITIEFYEKVKGLEGKIPSIQIGFSEDKDKEPEAYKEYSYDSEEAEEVKNWEILNEKVVYKYKIKGGDNGYIWVKVPEGELEDIAGNTNIYEEEGFLASENVFADTDAPTLTLNKGVNSEQEVGEIIRHLTFSENIYNLDGTSKGNITQSNAPIYKYHIGEGGEIRTANYVGTDGQIISYKLTTINSNGEKDTGKIYTTFGGENICDRAGNLYYTQEEDTMAPNLESVEISSNAGELAPYCKEGTQIRVVATFDEEINSQNMKLKIQIGEAEPFELGGSIESENNKQIVYTYIVNAGDSGEFKVIDICGETDDTILDGDKTYGYVADKMQYKRKIFNLEAEKITVIGKRPIADTTKPFIVRIMAEVNGVEISKYEKEEGKEESLELGRTNSNLIKYIITFNEPISELDKDKIIITNGIIVGNDIKAIEGTNNTKYEITVQTTLEGVQSLIFAEGAVKDSLGYLNLSERFNMVTTDFTKPIVRFISEYNGGVYVLPTNIGNVEIRPNIQIDEEISYIEYKWVDRNSQAGTDSQYERIVNYSSSSDITVPGKSFTEGTYELWIKVSDIAGNVTEAHKRYEIINSSIGIEFEDEYTNQDVIVTVKFREGLTDNRKVTFKAEGTDQVLEINASGTDEEGNVQYKIQTNGTIYVEATDRIGNKVFTEEKIENIDKEAPVIDIGVNGANLVIGTGEEKAKIIAKVNVTDNKEILGNYFAFYKEDINIEELNEEEREILIEKISMNAEDDMTLADSTKGEPYYLYVVALDEAGNEVLEKSGPYNIYDTNEREKITITEDENGKQVQTKEKIPADIETSKLISFKQEGKIVNITYNNFGENEENLNIIRESKITLTEATDGYIDPENNYVEVNKPTTITVIGIDACGNTVKNTYEVTKESIEGPKFEVYGNPEYWTNQNVELEAVADEELSALTVNGKNILSEDKFEGKKEITENGEYKFIATDIYGNISEKTIKVTKIDKNKPTISKVESSNKTITITATDVVNEIEGSGVAEYAITDTTETPIKWSESNEIKVTHDGIWYAWVMDNAGNIERSSEPIIVDTTAPTIRFDYTLLTVEPGIPIETNITTDEDAIISYSWDNEEWKTSEKLITTVKVTKTYSMTGKYTLYAKAVDKSGNESKAQIEFNVSKPTEVLDPQIVFEGLKVTQVDGVKYVKVAADMSTEDITNKMNKESLCGQTPEYTKLAEGNKIKTGSEITLNGDTKYVVVVNGDINSDGQIDFIKDIIRANNYRLGIIKLSVPQMLAADINNNGKIEFIQDIISINNYRLGLIKSL